MNLLPKIKNNLVKLLSSSEIETLVDITRRIERFGRTSRVNDTEAKIIDKILANHGEDLKRLIDPEVSSVLPNILKGKMKYQSLRQERIISSLYDVLCYVVKDKVPKFEKIQDLVFQEEIKDIQILPIQQENFISYNADRVEAIILNAITHDKKLTQQQAQVEQLNLRIVELQATNSHLEKELDIARIENSLMKSYEMVSQKMKEYAHCIRIICCMLPEYAPPSKRAEILKIAPCDFVRYKVYPQTFSEFWKTEVIDYVRNKNEEKDRNEGLFREIYSQSADLMLSCFEASKKQQQLYRCHTCFPDVEDLQKLKKKRECEKLLQIYDAQKRLEISECPEEEFRQIEEAWEMEKAKLLKQGTKYSSLPIIRNGYFEFQEKKRREKIEERYKAIEIQLKSQYQ